MKFPVTLAIIFASVTFAADPNMPSGAADAMPTDMPELSSLKDYAAKCGSETKLGSAASYIQDKCITILQSLSTKATPTSSNVPDGLFSLGLLVSIAGKREWPVIRLAVAGSPLKAMIKANGNFTRRHKF